MDAERAGQIVKLALDLLQRLRIGAQQVEIVRRDAEGGIGRRTEIVDVVEAEQPVGGILLIKHLDVLLHLADREVAGIIDEDRLHGLDLGGLDGGEELRRLVAVGGNGRDLRLVDLVDIGIDALALVNGCIDLGIELLVGPRHDVGLGHLRQAVELLHRTLPVHTVDEGVDIGHRAVAVLFERLHLAALVVGDRRGEQLFVEIAGPQLPDLIEQHVARLFERLPRLGIADGHHHAVVGQLEALRTHAQHFLLLLDIDVQQAALAVRKQRTHELDHVGVLARSAAGAPAQVDHFGLLPQHRLLDGSGHRRFGREGPFGQFGIGFQSAEVLVDRRDHPVGIEIARQADGHIVGHVISLVVILDVGDRRVLQILLRTQHGVHSVGMVRIERHHERVQHLAAVARERHVVLLVDGLQLGVESADHRIGETVGLDLRPVVDLVRGNLLGVDGHVVGGEGVRARGADGRHQLVVLVGNRQLRSLLRHGVDAGIDRTAFVGVGRGAVDLEQTLDLVEHRTLGLVILGAERLGALEHQVLEIVRQTGRFERIVLRTHAHGDVGLDAGRLPVHGHVDLQSVVQRVDTAMQRIVGDLLIAVLRTGRNDKAQHRCRYQ